MPEGGGRPSSASSTSCVVYLCVCVCFGECMCVHVCDNAVCDNAMRTALFPPLSFKPSHESKLIPHPIVNSKLKHTHALANHEASSAS